jgi:hypothetical protein
MQRWCKVGPECPAPDEFWEIFIEFAMKTARLDQRIPIDYEFSPFSLIFSKGHVPCQSPHLDVMWPNYQFLLMVSHETPGTIVYTSSCPVKDTDTFLEWLGPPVSSKIGPALREFPDMCQMLEDYGVVLDTSEDVMSPIFSLNTINQGEVLSMPGSVVHGAPSYVGFRAILFFIAHKKGKEEEAYDDERQYFAGIIMINIT